MARHLRFPAKIAFHGALLAAMWLGMCYVAVAEEPVRGIVRASREAQLSTELSTRVLQISRKEGEAFSKGDVLIAFDCDKYTTEWKAADAELQFNQIVLNNSIELDRRKAIGHIEVEQNRAKVDKAKAQADSLAVHVKACTIVAPYDGKVADMKAREFETSTPNQPLMRIVETGRPEIELLVPSQWLRWIGPKYRFRVRIDETGTEHVAEVQRISSTVDSISQTVKIMAILTDTDERILPGMSLTAMISQPTQ